MANIYTAAFSTIALTTVAQDLWEIVASSNNRVCIHEVRFGQTSVLLSSLAQNLGLTFIRNYDTGSSGGTAVTPISLGPSTAARASLTDVTRVSTTVASSSSLTPQTLHADVWPVYLYSYAYCPEECDKIWLEKSQRLVVRTTAPSAALTVSGTLVFEEVAQVVA